MFIASLMYCVFPRYGYHTKLGFVIRHKNYASNFCYSQVPFVSGVHPGEDIAMSSPIIAALRRRDDLKEPLQHTVQELAHIASIYGVARASLRYLAWKCNCCKQTIINHLKKLIDLKIIRKHVIWVKGNFCEINTYTFCISWNKRPAQMCHSKSFRQTLPPQEREKNCGVKEELENQKKGIRFLTPGTDLWRKVSEEIARLEELLIGKEGEKLC
jgi:hypothetical protein